MLRERKTSGEFLNEYKSWWIKDGCLCEISEYIIFIKCTHHEWIYMSQTVYFEGDLNFDDFWLNLISCLDLVPKRQQMVGFGLDWGKWFRIVWHSCAGFECGIYNERDIMFLGGGISNELQSYFPWQEDNLSQENLNLERKISTEWSLSSIFSSSCPFVLSPIPKWEWMLSQRSKVRWMVTLLKALRLIWSLLGIPLKGFALSLQVDKWPDWMRARPQDCDSFLLQSSHLRLTSFRATSNPVYLYTSIPGSDKNGRM